MITKRIIPCLDVKDGRVVKGANFVGLKDVNDPVELAKYYNNSMADELVFYDITASYENRNLFVQTLERVAKEIFIPLTVGGGINKIEDFDRVLKSGADKVSVNSGAVKNPNLIREAAEKYGNQCVVLSVDIKKVGQKYCVFVKGGRDNTNIDAIEWVIKGEKNGAGELVINSIDTDGIKNGFDIDLLKEISDNVSIPIIASGGAGKMEHFKEVFEVKGVDAGLAASIFHFKEIDIKDLKEYLKNNNIKARL
ncbi:imidazole glycerol phosphate synthase subunit HisF [Brachyspira catarrhinii]|uniref:Imidazole glycerol phosphate synthase subunit HisF n=1 Tax=Brachyspira catarrhinii TaxID=2528966 RepID=A0ABY2TS28_9SPIR|nr:imidazole glycerol phosphate synthase subunit HisF [Brachyspira catarrhinii]TKZ35574.1 imidazole glycerol phosphate synthase subunit HisF [Brachyspira catarrhinii]